MRRAIQIARLGEGLVSPNPMVGAVIVADNRIIGEGYHHKFGGPHAEVNAINSVAPDDRHLLPSSTIFVTLEPCSHYGKTPPCSLLIINSKIPRVVVGAPDPNPKVNGRGIQMMREAGVEVTEGVLAEECIELNRRFMTAQILKRPYIQLKWAQTADGFLSNPKDYDRLIISNPVSMISMHHQRSLADAIMVGVKTILTDNPGLDCCLWPGNNPLPVSFKSPNLPESGFKIANRILLKDSEESMEYFLNMLFREKGINSMMVEGGAVTLHSFLNSGLFDEIRIEQSPLVLSNLYPEKEGAVRAPFVNVELLYERGFVKEEFSYIGDNFISIYRRPMTEIMKVV